jgi:hypothetical protein
MKKLDAIIAPGTNSTVKFRKPKRQIFGLLALAASTVLAAGAAEAGCLTGQSNVCSPTINANGQVGGTSYTTLPFLSSIYGQSWGSSPGLIFNNLFWQVGTNFTNSNTMQAARQYADKLTGSGIVPASGAQRWEDTYEAARPAAAYNNEPGWINNDRWSQNLPNSAEAQAWVQWQGARANLFMMANDGGSVGTDFRPWNGNWGHISPMMPLPQGDWPPGMSNATYGDWFAYRWGQTAQLSGAYGIMLSDFTDSQPVSPSYLAGFNPELVDKFQSTIGQTIPGSSVSSRASYITSHFMAQWNDFIGNGYGRFFGALAARLRDGTGHQSLVINQCGQWASARRFQGVDHYIVSHNIPSANYICLWDDQTMQWGRSGQSMIWGIGGMVLAAAREPDIRNGGNLSADDSAFWQAVSGFWGNLSYNDQHERGLKELKRSWLETAWSHIATRQGTVRRALAFMSRDFWDGGNLDSTVQRLIQTIVPTRPFGYAVYYSTAAERIKEAGVPQAGINATYMHPDKLLAFKQGGGAVGYYVSNAAIYSLQSSARPAGWVVLDTLPPDEMSKLQSIAPVFTSLSAAMSNSNAPLSYSSGVTGMGFYDQSNRLIITVENPGNQGLNATVKLKGLPQGNYVATDLFTNAQIRFQAWNGQAAQIPVTITRWDTRVFAITPA